MPDNAQYRSVFKNGRDEDESNASQFSRARKIAVSPISGVQTLLQGAHLSRA